MTGYKYNLQEQYSCHVFDPTVIIPEVGLVYTAKFIKPMTKTSHCYQELDEAIKLNNLPSRLIGYDDMNPHLLYEQDHQIILDKIEAREEPNHDEYVKDKN